MRWMTVVTMAVAMAATTAGMGQAAQSSNTAPPAMPNVAGQEDSMAMLMEHGKKVLAKAAASADGSATEVLNRYPGYYTMLVARVKSGQVEVHTGYDDFFFIVDGELTETVGGKAEMKPIATPGELRAAAMMGGTPHVLRKGDIMHVQADALHWTTLQPGKTVIYYVIKIAAAK